MQAASLRGPAVPRGGLARPASPPEKRLFLVVAPRCARQALGGGEREKKGGKNK